MNAVLDLQDDLFEVAVAVDNLVHAHDRRQRGHLIHQAADVRHLATIAGLLPVAGIDPALQTYDRIIAIQALIEHLPEPQRDELLQVVADDQARNPWRPIRGPQTQLLEAKEQGVDLILAAGAAGSAKTDGAIGAALLSSSSVRFVRGTVGELTEILRRIANITGDVSQRNLSDQRWELPAPWGRNQRGLTISWFGAADEGQVRKIQGRPITTLVCDDAASGWLSENALEFMRQWQRSTGTEHVCTILSANPPTSRDSLWIRDSLFAPWLSPDYKGRRAESGEVRWFVRGDEVAQGTAGAESRTVIMSQTEANPYYVRSGYADRLKNISDPVLRARLALNDWSAGYQEDNPFAVYPSDWVDQAMQRWTVEPPCPLEVIGVDVARGGADRSTIACRHGTWFSAPIVIPGKDTPTGQSLAAKVLGVYKPGALCAIDSTGVGASPLDFLRERIPTSGIVFGAGTKMKDSTQSFEFANTRSWLFWNLRELLDPTNPDAIALPPDETLKRELQMPTYALRSGKVVVEDRASIIKRLGRSNDLTCAYILAAIPTNSILARNPQSDLLRAIANSNAEWREAMQEREQLEGETS